MKPGFLNETLDTRSSNGRDDVLLTALLFRDIDGTLYKVPEHADTDGGSTPRLAWLIPGFEPTGDHWFDWILHDGGYRGTLMVQRGVRWDMAELTRKECDRLLDRSLRLRKMGPVKRSLVYSSLRAAGWRHYQKTTP